MEKTELPQGFYFRDTDHSYFFDGKRMTGITTILGTIAKPALIGWASRMCAEYMEQNMDFQKITTADENWKQLLEDARNAHTKRKEAGATAGTDTHALAEEYIKDCIKLGTFPALTLVGEEKYKSIKPFMEWAMTKDIKFIASEQKLYSKDMFIAGTTDFIFEKDGKRYIGDIKTYKKLWDRVPMLQCAGYGIMWREMNGKDIDGYCVFNLPKERDFDETQDVRWSKDVAGDQEGFLAALSLYRILANW